MHAAWTRLWGVPRPPPVHAIPVPLGPSHIRHTEHLGSDGRAMANHEALDERTRLPRAARFVPVVFLVALIARVAPVVVGGGFHGLYGNDAGTYYAAAAGLVHGKLPYRDYVLVHPPLLPLLLTPFALLGRLTSDQTGFIAGNVALTVCGAVNAVLTMQVALRLGLGRRAALVGGLFYAVWFGAVGAEFLIRLEPLSNLLLLLALLALLKARAAGSTWWYLLGGAGLGLLVSVKIWWAAPILLLLAFELIATRSLRAIGLVVGGIVAAAAAVDGPFLILAGHQMVTMVVTSQFGRHRDLTFFERIESFAGTGQASLHLPPGAAAALGVVLVAALGIVIGLAWRVRPVRPFVVLVVVQVAVLLWSPSYYGYYSDYVSVAAALAVAGFAARSAQPRAAERTTRIPRLGSGLAPRLAQARWLPVAVAAIAAALVVGTAADTLVEPVPGASALAHQADGVRCIMADSANGLILLNALDRSFDPGCHNWVDVTARSFGAGDPADKVVRGRPNPRWSADLARYLMSGDATILILDRIGLSGSMRRVIEHGRVITSHGRFTVYRTDPSARLPAASAGDVPSPAG